MTVFISYARDDESAVTALHGDVEQLHRDAWFDQDVEGGQPWWDVILEQIRSCDLFVVALSQDWIDSKACQAELDYALALDRPLLPVTVGSANLETAPPQITATEIIDYRERSAETAFVLARAITHAPAPPPLPDPLPDPPPAPVSSLGPCREKVASVSLAYEEQADLLEELRHHAKNRDEREGVVGLLHQLRARPDIVESVGQDADVLIARYGVEDGRGVDASRGDSADLLRSLVTHIKTKHITAILGVGMSDSLIGSRRDLAREWARSFELPTFHRDEEDLAHVAQFVAVMSDQITLRESLAQYLRDQIRRRYPDLAAQPPDRGVDELLRSAWEEQRAKVTSDPHVVVASLPCPIFITAHPSNLLADALRVAGKQPRVEICRWRPDVYDWPASPFTAEPEYVPDVEQPLVFHVFGNLDAPDSLVLTEDDYLGFLVSVAEDKGLIPLPVRSALADSALLLLGFGLEEWDARILLLSLISQEGSSKLQRYTHVAAQVAPGPNVGSPARARRYLERYFGHTRRPPIDIYWGSVDEFVADLAEMWGADR